MDALPGSVSSAFSATINLSHIDTTHVLPDSLDVVADQDHTSNYHVMLAQVHKALHRSKSNSFSDLISSYFNNSQKTTSLCLALWSCIAKARRLYRPIQKLFNDLPLDYLSQSQCDLVFQEFGKFIEEANPFPGPESQTLDQIRDLFGVLNWQLERRLRKFNSKIRFVCPPIVGLNTICCKGAAITAYTPKFSKREQAYAAQLKVASRNTYILKTDLDTLDSLVRRFHNAMEDDRRLIRLGLGIMNDNNTVREVLKQLGKNQQNLGHNLDLLEQKITTCLIIVNQSRSLLLQEILHHQTSAEPSSHSQ